MVFLYSLDFDFSTNVIRRSHRSLKEGEDESKDDGASSTVARLALAVARLAKDSNRCLAAEAEIVRLRTQLDASSEKLNLIFLCLTGKSVLV